MDEDLVNMVIEDSQPFGIVEGSDSLFKHRTIPMSSSQGRYVCEHTKHVVPKCPILRVFSYFLYALKSMVEGRYEDSKEIAKAILSKASTVSLTSNIVDLYQH